MSASVSEEGTTQSREGPEMRSSFGTNSVYAGITGLCLTLGNFVSSIIIARLLGVEDTGLVAYAIWLISAVVIVADLGITITVARYVPELRGAGDENESDRLVAALLRPFAVSAILGPILIIPAVVFCLPGSVRGSSNLVWIVTAFGCCIQSLAAFGLVYLQATSQFRRAARRALTSFFILLVGLPIGVLILGPAGAIAAYLTSNTVCAAICFRFWGSKGRILPSLRPRVVTYARYNWVTAIVVAFVYSRLELLFLQQYQGSGATALFSVGLTLASLATQGPLLLTRGVFFYFAERVGAGDHSRVQQTMQTGTRLLAFLIFPTCLGTAAIMPSLLPTIYGKAFGQAVPAASVLVCAAGLVASQAIVSNLLLAYERNAFILWSGIGGAIAATIFGMTLVPTFGVMGAAFGRGAIQLSLWCIGVFYVVRILRIPVPLGDLGRLLIAALLCAAAARWCIMTFTGTTGLLIAIATGGIIYVAAVRIIGALPEKDLNYLRAALPGVPASLHNAIALIAKTRAPLRYGNVYASRDEGKL